MAFLFFSTTIGHVFTAYRVSSDSRLNGQFVDYFIADGSPVYQFSWRNHLGNPGCVNEEVDSPPEDGECNNVDLMFYEDTFKHWHKTRLALNYVQVRVIKFSIKLVVPDVKRDKTS
jgi:hypothetical protein